MWEGHKICVFLIISEFYGLKLSLDKVLQKHTSGQWGVWYLLHAFIKESWAFKNFCTFLHHYLIKVGPFEFLEVRDCTKDVFVEVFTVCLFSACDCDQAWWADGRGRDGGGPPELPQDEHLPWQCGPLVLAKAQVCCRLNGDDKWQQFFPGTHCHTEERFLPLEKGFSGPHWIR